MFVWLDSFMLARYLWLITDEVSAPKLPFNLPIHTCLLLGCDWNTNVMNANANQRLTKTGAAPLRWLGTKALVCLCAGPASHTGSPQLCASCWQQQCCQHLTERSLSTSTLCCFSCWINRKLLEWNQCKTSWKLLYALLEVFSIRHAIV